MNFSELKGKVLTRIEGAEPGSDEILFYIGNDRHRMYHEQDCCESVDVAEVIGDIQDLIGTPILDAYEETSDASAHTGDSGTWTFYRLTTIKGTVTLRWLGSSNGYYSESVTFE